MYLATLARLSAAAAIALCAAAVQPLPAGDGASAPQSTRGVGCAAPTEQPTSPAAITAAART